MQLTAKLIKVLPIQSGTGQNGAWKKQDIIVETDGQYARNVCISIWGDKINENQLQVGNILIIDFVPDSKEFKDKWYTTLIATNIEISNFNRHIESEVSLKNQTEGRIDESISFQNITFQGKIGSASDTGDKHPEKLNIADKDTDGLSSPTSEQAQEIVSILKKFAEAGKLIKAKEPSCKLIKAKEPSSGNNKNPLSEQSEGAFAKLRGKLDALKHEAVRGTPVDNSDPKHKDIANKSKEELDLEEDEFL